MTSDVKVPTTILTVSIPRHGHRARHRGVMFLTRVQRDEQRPGTTRTRSARYPTKRWRSVTHLLTKHQEPMFTCDKEAKNGRLPPLLAQAKSKDRQTPQPGHVSVAHRGSPA